MRGVASLGSKPVITPVERRNEAAICRVPGWSLTSAPGAGPAWRLLRNVSLAGFGTSLVFRGILCRT